MMSGRKFVIFLFALMLMVNLVGCGKEKPQTESLQQPVSPVEPSEAATVPQKEEENLNVVKISTPYGDLYYQEQWSEHMRVTQQEQDGVLQVSFCAEFNGMQYPLFDLLVGVEAEDSVAQLTDAEGTVRDVGVNFLELGEYPELAEDEQNQLYAMQEDINFVVDNIK